MPDDDEIAHPGSGLVGYPGFFLILTFIVMIVIVLTTRDLKSSMILIGLITSFLIISSQLTFLGDRHMTGGPSANRSAAGRPAVMPMDMSMAFSEAMTSGDRPSGEAMTSGGATTAPPGAGPPAFLGVPETADDTAAYPGAIDFGTRGEVDGDEAPALGHTDLYEAARDNTPEGNPFSAERVAAPQAAGPCVDDDAIAIYDGDELLAIQARSRNDPERVWAGNYRRKAHVGRYITEELDEEENKRWWGAHEV